MSPARRRPARLFLERLEQRDCPSLTVTLFGGSLNVSGSPTGALAVTEATPGKLTVMDGTHSLGTYGVGGDLRLSLTNHPSTITVDLGGNTFTGNILISLGNGGTTTLPPEVSVQRGTVGGNVTFLGGNGTETENIGGPALAPIPVVVRGSVQATGKVSGGGDAGPGDTLFIGPGSSVGGDVTTTQIDNVAVGQPALALTTVGGNVNVNDSGSGAALTVNIFGNVNKSVSVTGTSFEDNFVLQQASAGVGGNVLGNLYVDLGAGGTLGDSFLLDTGTTVGGSATLSTRGAPAVAAPGGFTVNGTVNGSLTANLGEGNDSFAFNAAASVAGNLSVTGGNGNNTVTAAGAVGGNLSFTFGSGNDSVTVTSAPGGQLRWTSGNGNDSLTLAPTAASAFNVNVHFGTGDDSLTLAGTASTLSGLVDGGGGTNVFTQDGWTIVPPFTLQNF
jgi:hypothetical protein